MTGLGLWLLLIFGLVYLGTAAVVTKRPRDFLKARAGPLLRGVLSCAPCFSFWVGLAVGPPVGWRLLVWLGLESPWSEYLSPLAGGVIALGFVSLVQWYVGAPIAEQQELVNDETDID